MGLSSSFGTKWCTWALFSLFLPSYAALDFSLPLPFSPLTLLLSPISLSHPSSFRLPSQPQSLNELRVLSALLNWSLSSYLSRVSQSLLWFAWKLGGKRMEEKGNAPRDKKDKLIVQWGSCPTCTNPMVSEVPFHPRHMKIKIVNLHMARLSPKCIR